MEFISSKAIRLIGRTMGINRLLGGALFALVAGCVNAAPPTVGVVEGSVRGDWTLYVARFIEPGEKVRIQYADRASRIDCCAQVALVGGGKKQDNIVVTDEYEDRDVWVYRIRPTASLKLTRPFVGIAVVGDAADVHGVGDLVHVVDGDKVLVASSCLSDEGVHVMLRRDKKLAAHLYLQLDYSVSPTCADDAFK